jgi:nucleotide-binding universal stress UspA family protein
VADITVEEEQVGEAGSTMDAYNYEQPHFRNILYLTDFSPCSDAALTWAVSVAKANGAKVYTLHVAIPDALAFLAPGSPGAVMDMHEEWARGQMERIESQLAEVEHETLIERGSDLWKVVESKLQQFKTDLVVLGTHGRTGLRKVLMGSAAERVLRHSPVPVMTVGPAAHDGRTHDGKFHKLLLATDFAEGSAETASYAISFAERNRSDLTLVHVCKTNKRSSREKTKELSIAEALYQLQEMVPGRDAIQIRPDALVECGDPGDRILDVAKRCGADLIVMGIHNSHRVFAATHLEISTAHEVVAHSICPVLTVRPPIQQTQVA